MQRREHLCILSAHSYTDCTDCLQRVCSLWGDAAAVKMIDFAESAAEVRSRICIFWLRRCFARHLLVAAYVPRTLAPLFVFLLLICLFFFHLIILPLFLFFCSLETVYRVRKTLKSLHGILDMLCFHNILSFSYFSKNLHYFSESKT